MRKEEAILLAEKIVSGTATEAEILQYNQLFNAFQEQDGWDEQLLGDQQQLETAIRQRLQPVLSRRRPGKMLRWYKWAAAAAVAGIFGTTYYFSGREHLQPQAVRFHNDIPAPAGSHAVLTLGNGQQILLDSAGNGVLALQGQVQVAKNAAGQIVYSGNDQRSSFNTLQVPPGSRPLAIALADGTRIWMDAGATLTYPTAFHGGKREVMMSGQAYFEVAQNSQQPFSVISTTNHTNIDVLGTAFNVRAFRDAGNLEVTLVSGAVKVNTTATSQLMHPGEQLAVRTNGSVQLLTNADLQEATAWKEGLFYFNGADITTIMSALQRYYDIDVAYQADVKDLFVAKIPRDVPVSRLLNLLEMTNLVHFKIEGRKVTVIK
ncbi:FecR family protein [Chitinophaga qingshengii]|uniref:FecR domain-containing protein n=1 Tax=Chitinophaga qingshengii TaxID=1569794 RepID=A0ABR7TPU3_9BACT|nr:FecR family protein [Chitinophaga qingshengii]MBC9932010.1 FecR domain-containing protein [Chitinophaga qingshengii]